MIEQRFRHYFQWVAVDPLVRLIDQKISPMFITFTSGVLGFCFIPFLLLGMPLLATIILIISGYCDILDGSLARHQGTQSDFGSVLDIVMDRVVEFAVIFGFYLLNPERNALMCVLMLGSILICITSFLVVGIFIQKDGHKSFHYSPGLMERAEAFVFFGLMAFLPTYFKWLASVFVILVLYTAAHRLYQFYSNSKRLSI